MTKLSYFKNTVIFQPYTFEIDLGTSKNFTIRLT